MVRKKTTTTNNGGGRRGGGIAEKDDGITSKFRDALTMMDILFG